MLRDANQVGYVSTKTRLGRKSRKFFDNALRIKPRRQMSVSSLSGERPMQPAYFLQAVSPRPPRSATTACSRHQTDIEFAKSKEFCKRALKDECVYATCS